VTPLITVSNRGVVVEAVKLAEDRSGDVIVRLYESLGQRCATTVTASFATDRIYCTDLLERALDGVLPDPVGQSIALSLRPFELVTLRFRREPAAGPG